MCWIAERFRLSQHECSVKKIFVSSFFSGLVVSTGNLKNTRPEEDWKTRMKIDLSRMIAAVLLATVVLTGGCALDPYAPGPDMNTEIPPGGAPASGTGNL
jgi:hypothetical protein